MKPKTKYPEGSEYLKGIVDALIHIKGMIMQNATKRDILNFINSRTTKRDEPR